MVVSWVSPLGPIGPCPDEGSLSVVVPCRTRRGTRGRPHEVVIGPDWSVLTPHDLEAERVGVALGGYLSCVDLVDRTVPALRDLAQLLARRTLPPLGRNFAGRWVVEQPTVRCGCETGTFATPYEAAQHVRTAGHLARRYGADPVGLAKLLDEVETAHGGFRTCPPQGWTSLALVREPRGLDLLWGAGVPPELVEDVQDSVLPRGGPLPASAYLGAAFHCQDLDWFAATVGRRPDPDVAVWAAWAYGDGDRAHPYLRGDWLELGVVRSAIDVLVERGVSVAVAEQLAEVTGRSVQRAAQLLATWERAGCRPGAGDIAALDVLGIGDTYEPSAAAIRAVMRDAVDAPMRPTWTQVAVLLGLAGTRAEAERLIQQGAVTAEQAMAALTGVVMWETDTRRTGSG